MSEDEEDWEAYVKGGYHPVNIGDTFSNGRYVVVRKLGWGPFSTVWLAKDTTNNRHVALKVVKSAPRSTEEALHEIELLQHLNPSSTTHAGRSHVVSFLDHFLHEGPNGVHICMVFEALGESLASLIKRHGDKGVPMHLVKQIAKQILLGLDYIHRCCGIIHTDLKPQNVLITIDDIESVLSVELAVPSSTDSSNRNLHVSAENPKTAPIPTRKLLSVPPIKSEKGGREIVTEAGEQQDRITVKIVDFRSWTWEAHHFTDDIQTRQYRCPEAILGAKWGTSADLWSVACILFELMTSESLFEPAAGARYSTDEDHIAQIIELLGKMPTSIALSGKYSRKFFNRKGKLRHTRKLSYRSLESVLHSKHLLRPSAIAAFLTPMLRFDAEKRARARELTDHRWLKGVVVQGEIDVIRRAEEEESWRRRCERELRTPRAKKGKKRKRGVSAPGSADNDASMSSVVESMLLDTRSIPARKQVTTIFTQPNSVDRPQYYDSEVSEVFTELEYNEIVAYYNIHGLDACNIIPDIPRFESRGKLVLDLCRRMEDHKMEQRTRNFDQLKALQDEIKDWTTQKRPNKQEVEGSKRKEKVPLSNPDYEALLSHFENMKPGQRSPTSSSSGYGTASSVRSRSSMSMDPNEFPYSFRPIDPNSPERDRSTSPTVLSTQNAIISFKGTVAPATSSSELSKAPVSSTQRYRLLLSFFKIKKATWRTWTGRKGAAKEPNDGNVTRVGNKTVGNT